MSNRLKQLLEDIVTVQKTKLPGETTIHILPNPKCAAITEFEPRVFYSWMEKGTSHLRYSEAQCIRQSQSWGSMKEQDARPPNKNIK